MVCDIGEERSASEYMGTSSSVKSSFVSRGKVRRVRRRKVEKRGFYPYTLKMETGVFFQTLVLALVLNQITMCHMSENCGLNTYRCENVRSC
jgi:hypothetical protein